MTPEDLEGPVPEETEYVEEMAKQAAEQMIPVENFQPPEHDQLTECPSGEIRGLVFYPDKRLKVVSEVVPEDFEADDMDKLIADMATTMYSIGGIGLSAVQIGIPLRVFICDIFANSPRQKGQPGSQLLVAVNPEIGWTSKEKDRSEEGCLSFPGILEAINRPATIGLRGNSRRGKPFALRAGGLLGRVIQHEMDHLDGVTFVERMGGMQKKIVSKKMLKFHRGVRQDTLRIVKKGSENIKDPEKRKKSMAEAEPVVQKAVEAINDEVKKRGG